MSLSRRVTSALVVQRDRPIEPESPLAVTCSSTVTFPVPVTSSGARALSPTDDRRPHWHPRPPPTNYAIPEPEHRARHGRQFDSDFTPDHFKRFPFVCLQYAEKANISMRRGGATDLQFQHNPHERPTHYHFLAPNNCRLLNAPFLLYS